ncbi:MAG TPA: glycosyl hydrolase family 28-related protein [Saprospiraceae bacterium]|nr:glycosyl hydrolase family 28-related protein [Saprospiraceae bacterium]
MIKFAARLLPFLLFPCLIGAQTVPDERRSDWFTSGLQALPPLYTAQRNILDFGGKGDSLTLNELAFAQAVASLNGQPGEIYFPPGAYLFKGTLLMRDSLILRGAGADQTRFYFDLGGSTQHGIRFLGQVSPLTEALPLSAPCMRGDTQLFLQHNLHAGDLLRLEWNDSLVIFSDWARGSAGQILEVTTVQAGQITVNHPLRIQAPLSAQPRLRRITPLKDAGVECISLTRMDGDAPFASNISLEYAYRCWLAGVESAQCNFGHFTLDASTHCEIYGCYLHDAFAYGGGGQGYGVVLQYTSGDNRIQNNIFRHLRHSMLLQSGANGNVLAYNFSTEPYWVEFPNDGAGEIVFHGNYPSYNLFEGNICKNIRPDGSHGLNGPYNTLFRNRTSGYGIVFTSPEYQSHYNIIGNEIQQGGILQGLYLVSGANNLEIGNSQNGNLVPVNSGIASETSLYWNTPPAYLSVVNYLIGPPASFNTGSIPARERFLQAGVKTDCTVREGLTVDVTEYKPAIPPVFQLIPNPASTSFFIQSEHVGFLEIIDLSGRKWWSGQIDQGTQTIPCAPWPNGMYLVILKTDSGTGHHWLVKSAR